MHRTAPARSTPRTASRRAGTAASRSPRPARPRGTVARSRSIRCWRARTHGDAIALERRLELVGWSSLTRSTTSASVARGSISRAAAARAAWLASSWSQPIARIASASRPSNARRRSSSSYCSRPIGQSSASLRQVCVRIHALWPSIAALAPSTARRRRLASVAANPESDGRPSAAARISSRKPGRFRLAFSSISSHGRTCDPTARVRCAARKVGAASRRAEMDTRRSGSGAKSRVKSGNRASPSADAPVERRCQMRRLSAR